MLNLESNRHFKENSLHKQIMTIIKPHKGIVPTIHPEGFVAPNATLIGDVEIHKHANIWYGAVLRGDVGSICIGARSNIQDLCMVHCTSDHSKVHVGEDVTVGHNAILHGCILKDCCLVGMGAIIMDNAIVESNTIVGAGSVVLENQRLESGFLYAGSPAKQIKPLTPTQIQQLTQSAAHYVEQIKYHI